MIVIPNVFSKLQSVKILVKPLSKKRPLKKRFDSQHMKAFQIFANFPLEHFYPVFFLILREVDLENVSTSVT